MTVATTNQGPNPWAEFAGAGLEDVSASDLQLPRLKIDGPSTSLVNSVTNESFPELTMIFLGLIKQRSYFAPLTKETEKLGPICRSNDFDAGFPSEPYNSRSPIFFPWEASGFNPQTDGQLDTELNRVRLSCDLCKLREWNGDNPPLCNEMHTYPVLYSHPTTAELIPAIFSVKSSAIKNSRNFISAFAAQSRPMFTAWTKVTLTAARRGNITYAVPNFAPLFDPSQITPQDQWQGWYQQWNQIRDLQRMPPRPFESEELPESSGDQSVSGTVIEGGVSGPSPWQDFQDASPGQNGAVEWPAPQASTPAAAPPAAPSAPPAPAPAAPPPAPPAAPSHGRVAPPSAMSEPTAPVQAPPVTPVAPAAPPAQPVATPPPPASPPSAPPARPPAAPQAQAAAPQPPVAVTASNDDLPF